MAVPLPALDTSQLTLVPAAPESLLSPEVVAALPSTAPAAPWHCTVTGFVWLQRAGTGAASLLPPPLDAGASPRWVCGAFLSYRGSPVGQYSEVLGGVVLRQGWRPLVHVPFMAVDSPTSLRGGRANWALPKTLAAFGGAPQGLSSSRGPLTARGRGWSVRVRGRALGPGVPVRLRGRCAQVRPDGAVSLMRVAFRGEARLAHVDTEVESHAGGNPSLADWMPSGRHLAQRINGALEVGAAVAP